MDLWELCLAGAVAALALLAIALAGERWQRLRYYRNLAASRSAVVAAHAAPITTPANPRELAAAFRENFIVRADDVLPPETLTALAGEAATNVSRVERSYLPTHKKGGTLSYESIHLHAPRCLAVYHSPQLHAWVSQVVGMPIQPTADHDQSSCSLLYYNEAGDHIHWHFDHNFYRGRHFTVLISLVNRGANGGLSAGELQRKTPTGQVESFNTGVNSIVVFEGKRVLHRASPVEPGDERIMLSMTFTTNPAISWVWELVRRIKDTAYYGPRVLWQ